jgi:hypothetical protein
MMTRALYLGEGRWKTLTSAGSEFRAKNESGREPQVNDSYTLQVMDKIKHCNGVTTRKKVILYLV